VRIGNELVDYFLNESDRYDPERYNHKKEMTGLEDLIEI